jgi:hypothetical protein
MADQEEDFSSLPLEDRFQHKVWDLYPLYKARREKLTLVSNLRYGKYEKAHTRMLQNNLKKLQARTTLLSGHSYKTLVSGKELYQTRMLPHIRRVLRLSVLFSNSEVGKVVQGIHLRILLYKIRKSDFCFSGRGATQ